MSSNNTTQPQFGQCHPTFNEDVKCDVIFGFRCAIAILSMLCCLFLVFIIVVFKKYKFLHQRLILYLSIGAFFQGLGYAVSDYKISYHAQQTGDNGFCIFLGIWTLWFDWFSFLWVCCITFNIFWNAVFLKTTKKFEKFYWVVCVVVPTILCCMPFIESSYGPAGLWCWIRSTTFDIETDMVKVFRTGVILQLIVFYIPLWLLSLVLLVVLISVACLVRHRTRKYQGIYSPKVDAQKRLWEDEIRPLVVFPWIYLVILIFPVMNRLRQAAGFFEPESGANFFFWFMHAVTLTLHGTLYALVFACDKQTRSRITYPQIKAAILQRRIKRRKIKEYPISESAFTDDSVVDSFSPKYVSDEPCLQEDAPSSYELYTDSNEH